MDTLEQLNTEIAKQKQNLQILIEKQDNIYQDYAYFLTQEYSNGLSECFIKGHNYNEALNPDEHKHYLLQILSSVINEYTSINPNIITSFSIGEDIICRLFNFRALNGQIYIVLETQDKRTLKCTYTTYVQSNEINIDDELISFTALQDFICNLLLDKSVKDKEKVSKIIEGLMKKGIKPEEILESINNIALKLIEEKN